MITLPSSRPLVIGVAAAVVMGLLASCDDGRRPEAADRTSNATYEVDRLFTHDGCTVYRFYDRSEYRYFVRCDGGAAGTEWDTNRYDPSTKTTKTERYSIPTGCQGSAR